MSSPFATILINNYNYGRYLGRAIESALGQTYGSTEVVVVDDGSSDESPAIISGYGKRIVPVFKPNGGQASAFNIGVAASRGDIICLLDADDFFHARKVETVVERFVELGYCSQPILVHHPLEIFDNVRGQMTGRIMGCSHESPLNLYGYARKYKHVPYPAAPTSGVSINRILVNRLFPLPESGVMTSADDLVVKGAALIAHLYALDQVLGGYRVHGGNRWFGARRTIPREFIRALDEYLNRKLEENGLSPTICWDDSMYSWSNLALNKRWLELGRKIFLALLRQRDLHTAKFVYWTMKVEAAELLLRIGRR